MNNVKRIKYSSNTQTFVVVVNTQMIKEAHRREKERKENENKMLYRKFHDFLDQFSCNMRPKGIEMSDFEESPCTSSMRKGVEEEWIRPNNNTNNNDFVIESIDNF